MKIVRNLVVTVYIILGFYAIWWCSVWNERRDVRKDQLEFSGYGSLFVLGVLVLAFGIVYALRLSNHNKNVASLALAIICAVAIVLLALFVAPQIMWAASFRAMLAIGAVILYFVFLNVILAIFDRHSS